MQRKPDTTSQWREFDVIRVFEDESNALRYAVSEGVLVNPR